MSTANFVASVVLAANDSARAIHGQVVARPTAALPQTATGHIFTVSGGRVVVTLLYGEVTVAIQNQANNLKITSTPTVGNAVDLCAVLNVANLQVGILLGMTGTLATALQSGYALPAQAAPLVVPAGAIDLIASASNTGSVKWTVRWVPLDDGAVLVVA